MTTKDPLLGRITAFAIYTICYEALIWGIFGWGWRRRWWRYDPYYDPHYGPGGFEEWHRRAHERMNDGRAAAPPAP